MIEKGSGIPDLMEALSTSALFASVGMAIGIGRLMNSGETLTWRLLVGRALSTAGIAMAAGAVLVWVPNLPLLGQIGIAAGLASLGTAGLERLFSRAVDNAGNLLKGADNEPN
jgi:hypothetical protein